MHVSRTIASRHTCPRARKNVREKRHQTRTTTQTQSRRPTFLWNAQATRPARTRTGTSEQSTNGESMRTDQRRTSRRRTTHFSGRFVCSPRSRQEVLQATAAPRRRLAVRRVRCRTTEERHFSAVETRHSGVAASLFLQILLPHRESRVGALRRETRAWPHSQQQAAQQKQVPKNGGSSKRLV